MICPSVKQMLMFLFTFCNIHYIYLHSISLAEHIKSSSTFANTNCLTKAHGYFTEHPSNNLTVRFCLLIRYYQDSLLVIYCSFLTGTLLIIGCFCTILIIHLFSDWLISTPILVRQWLGFSYVPFLIYYHHECQTQRFSS